MACVHVKLNSGFFAFISAMALAVSLFPQMDGYASSNNTKDLELSQTNLIQDQGKYKHLIGIVHNTGNNTANQIIVSANLLDGDKKSLGNFSKQAELRTLNPKEITPFDILIFDKKNNERIKDYNVDIKYNITNHKDKKLDIVTNDSRLDMTGFFFISGKIKNMEKGVYSNNTNVISILYDKNNEMVGVWKAQTEPYSIPPLATASFTIPITDKTQSFRISNYELLTESDNFSELK